MSNRKSVHVGKEERMGNIQLWHNRMPVAVINEERGGNSVWGSEINVKSSISRS